MTPNEIEYRRRNAADFLGRRIHNISSLQSALEKCKFELNRLSSHEAERNIVRLEQFFVQWAQFMPPASTSRLVDDTSFENHVVNLLQQHLKRRISFEMDMESDEFRPPASTLRLGDTSFENHVNLLQQYLERISREKEKELDELCEMRDFIDCMSREMTKLQEECATWKTVAYGAATRDTKVFPPRRGDAIESVGEIVTRGYAACRVFNGKATRHPLTGALRGVGNIEYTDSDNNHIRLQATEEKGEILYFLNGEVHPQVITSCVYHPQTHELRVMSADVAHQWHLSRLLDDHPKMLGCSIKPKEGLSSSTSRELFALFHSQEVECTTRTLPAFITATIPIEPVIIQYAIEPSTPAIVATKIRHAIQILQVDVPGVRLTENSTLHVQDASGKLVFQSERGVGCWSHVGIIGTYSGNNRIINIDPNWTVDKPGQGPPIGTILHELLHTLGVSHEHQRSDRSDNVEVDAGSIQSNKANFAETANIHPFRYDYASIMHYPSGAGLNPSPKAWAIVGQRECLSPLDKLFINWLYPAPKQDGIYEPKMSMQTGLWYCGRGVMEKHNYPDPMITGCNGSCGPYDGPNCPTCIIYGVGCGNSFQLQRINQQGIVSIQGETGLFYCGRVMEHGGNCGPDHGPNCLECHNYLTKSV